MNESLTLYHGTDARLIAFSETERYTYLEDCKKVIQYLWSIFKPYYVTQELVETKINGEKAYILQRKIEQYKHCIIEQSDKNVWYNLFEKLIMLEANENGSPNYQYGDLYLTGDKNKAKSYVLRSFAGGEIGSIAYRLIQGAEILEWINLDEQDEVYKAIGKIKQFAEDKPNPVVLKIKDISVGNLLLENGNPVKQKDLALVRYCSFRYKDNFDLSMDNVEYEILN